MHFYRKMIIFVDKYDQGKDIMAGIGRGNAPSYGAASPLLPSRNGPFPWMGHEMRHTLQGKCRKG